MRKISGSEAASLMREAVRLGQLVAKYNRPTRFDQELSDTLAELADHGYSTDYQAYEHPADVPSEI